MKSAYLTLGVPGNASVEDIELAFARAQLYYNHDRIALNPALADKFADVRNAFKVLRDPEQRAAHDRRLSSSAAPAPRRAMPPPSPVVIEGGVNPLVIIGVVIALLLGGGAYWQARRAAQKQEQMALEAETARKVAEADAQARLQQAEESAARARAAVLAAQQDRTERREAEYAIQRATSVQIQRDYAQTRLQQQLVSDERSREQRARQDEQQRVYEAQRRLAADKARIRELCYQNYRRSDC